jgi:hypothetical protein
MPDGRPREDVTEGSTQTRAVPEAFRFHRFGVRAALCEWLACCALCAPPVLVTFGANGFFPSSREDATKLTSIIPLSNPYTRTTGFHGTRIRMAEPPGTKSASLLTALYCETPDISL